MRFAPCLSLEQERYKNGKAAHLINEPPFFTGWHIKPP